MLRITDSLTIPEEEISFSAVRSSGPGGQHVNKTASTVQLRFNAASSPSLPESVRSRLLRQQAGRINHEGELIINACSYRSQYRNRKDAMDRLREMIATAAVPPPRRKKTHIPRNEKQKRRENKSRQSMKKNLRRPPES